MSEAARDRAFEAPHLIDVMDEARNYNAWLLGHVLRSAGDARRVLDFGAGNGRFTLAVAAHGLEVHAVEPDAALRERVAAGGISTAASLDALPQDTPFDFAWSLNVLEHIEDDVGILRSLAGRLRAGGRLLLYVPAFERLWNANDVRVGHVRRYEKATLEQRVREAGLAVLDARYADCLGFAAALVYRRLGDPSGELGTGSVRLYDRAVFPLSRLLDRLLHPLVGKNLMLLAERPSA